MEPLLILFYEMTRPESDYVVLTGVDAAVQNAVQRTSAASSNNLPRTAATVSPFLWPRARFLGVGTVVSIQLSTSVVFC